MQKKIIFSILSFTILPISVFGIEPVYQNLFRKMGIVESHVGGADEFSSGKYCAALNPDVTPIFSEKDEEPVSHSKNFGPCMRELCGEPTSFKNLLEMGEAIFPEIKNSKSLEQISEVKSLSREIALWEVKSLKNTTDSLLSSINSSKLEIKKNMQAVHRKKILDYFHNYIQPKHFWQAEMNLDDVNSVFEIPLHPNDSLSPLMDEIADVQFNNIFDSLNKFNDSQEYGRVKYSQLVSGTAIYSSIYPQNSLSEIISIVREEILEIKQRIKDKYPNKFSLILDELPSENWLLNLEEKTPTDKELNRFFKAHLESQLLKRFLLNSPDNESIIASSGIGDSNSYGDSIKYNQLDEIFNTENLKKSVTEVRDQISSVGKLSKISEEVSSYCESVIRDGINVLPSESERAEIAADIDRIKAEFYVYLDSKLSKKTSGNVAIYLSKVPISMPPSKEYFISRLKSDLSEALKNTKARYNRTLGSAGVQNSLLFSYDSKSWTSEKFISSLKNTCSSHEVSLKVHDANFMTQVSAMRLSLINLKNPASRKAIFAHELSHAASNYIQRNPTSKKSAKSYKQARLCLGASQRSHPDPVMSEKIQYKNIFGSLVTEEFVNSLNVEENFADLLASEFTSDQKNNWACSLFPKKDGQYVEQDLFKTHKVEYGPWGGISKIPDRHSPELYRLLHAAYIRNGQLPDSCGWLLVDKNVGRGITNCFPTSGKNK